MRIVLGFCLLLLAGVTHAEPHPLDVVKNTAAQVIAKMNQEGGSLVKDEKRLYSLIDKLIIPHFDFEKMSKRALGRHWSQANQGQRNAFIREFKSMLVRTYASSLSEYADKPIVYLPFKGDLSSGKVEIKSEVEIPGSFPVPISYRMHKIGDRWLVYDVAIDEISLIANYRTSFAQEIRKNGVDKLIEDLAAKNNQ